MSRPIPSDLTSRSVQMNPASPMRLPPTRCGCQIVREAEAQRALVKAFNMMPGRHEEPVIRRERLLCDEAVHRTVSLRALATEMLVVSIYQPTVDKN